jgi:hypothetical protein
LWGITQKISMKNVRLTIKAIALRQVLSQCSTLRSSNCALETIN